MGASGAGKTSFLNALCDRIKSDDKNKVSGRVLINNEIEVRQKNFGNYGAYVMQDDILSDYLTCWECLEFAAWLWLNIDDEII